VLLGGGMAVAAEGWLPGFAASAIIGGGAAVSTPTSSQLLYRVSPTPPSPADVFDQADRCPRGPALISGFLAPTIAGALGWRGAALITAAGIVSLSGRGMLVVSVARKLGLGNSFARLSCCPAQAERTGKRRPRSTKLTIPSGRIATFTPSAIASSHGPVRRSQPLPKSSTT
jgi:hypothetical protein